MSRTVCMTVLTLLAALIASSASAELIIEQLERKTVARVIAWGAPIVEDIDEESSAEAGVFTGDVSAAVDYEVHASQQSVVTVSESDVHVSGAVAVDIVRDEPGLYGTGSAYSYVRLRVVPTEDYRVDIDARDFATSGEAACIRVMVFDETGDPSIIYISGDDGDQTASIELEPLRVYTIQVYAGANHQSSLAVEGAASGICELSIVPDGPVAAETTSWSAVKSLF